MALVVRSFEMASALNNAEVEQRPTSGWDSVDITDLDIAQVAVLIGRCSLLVKTMLARLLVDGVVRVMPGTNLLDGAENATGGADPPRTRPAHALSTWAAAVSAQITASAQSTRPGGAPLRDVVARLQTSADYQALYDDLTHRRLVLDPRRLTIASEPPYVVMAWSFIGLVLTLIARFGVDLSSTVSVIVTECIWGLLVIFVGLWSGPDHRPASTNMAKEMAYCPG